jgi:hypothetical protein
VQKERASVALPKIGFNEGSLLRRTVLHVATFLLGSMAFIGLVSFVLVSVAKGLVAPRSEGPTDTDPEAVASAVAPVRGGKPPAAAAKVPRKRGAHAPAAPSEPAKED